jgi:tetratricopeptide (TPR) repeat protein
MVAARASLGVNWRPMALLLSARRVLFAALALGAPLLVVTPLVAAAGTSAARTTGQDGGQPAMSSPAKAANYDPEDVTAISKFMETCVVGNTKYVAKDFAGARDNYQKASALAPKNPFAVYLLAEAELALGDLPAADAALKSAEANADDRNPALRAKILFLTADLLERQKKWDDAKLAWKTYGEYVGKHADAGAPQSAPTRVQSIDDMMKQDRAYEVVRQRILAEKDAGAGAAPDAALPRKP